MPRHFKVHEELTREQLDELETFAREPGRTVDDCHDWLLAHGFTMSRGAVYNWQTTFNQDDKLRRASEVSRNYLAAGKDAGAAEIASATLLKFQQILFEHMLGADAADAGELLKLSVSLKTAVEAGRHIEKLRDEFQTRQRAAVEEAEKTAKSGGSGEAVAKKMRELLGV
jgi:hypothetical protein